MSQTALIKTKSKDEARGTIAESRLIDHGFLKSNHCLLLWVAERRYKTVDPEGFWTSSL
jgi:hypothetical protein